ncbi:alpha/beta fold hydrolase [Tianweitania sediminis]|uniref:Alpha/beta hydrolase n=1 Tax=Tianweitania sediminis TaxID=1502156 RepID=A0A8J7RGX8_9HYPH|nr:alpha/beta hydrolase [Tianweitania sediminis]MBP0437046.1 alpha/beta hydrolase [Tianweitania sediminis]
MSARTDDADSLLDANWRASRRRINGLDLHIVEAGDPNAPLVVLLHGFPEFWWAWRHQITPLAQAGFHVIVPDMRGYNKSDAPQEVRAYTLPILAADVIALADAFGAARFHLVGHDWGAVIGWWVAARHPGRVMRAVLMNGPHPDILAKQALKHPTQALRSTYVAFFQLPWIPEATLGGFDFSLLKAMVASSARPGAFEPGALERYVEAWSHPGSLTAMLNYYRALRQRPRSKRPARVEPPTLVLWADEDRFLERHVAEASVAVCNNGTLEMVEGASHWLHLEQPETISTRIIAWIGERWAVANSARRSEGNTTSGS